MPKTIISIHYLDRMCREASIEEEKKMGLFALEPWGCGGNDI